MNWYLAVLKKYAVFSGRARRKEFWFFGLFNVIFAVVLAGIGAATAESVPAVGLLYPLYALAVFLPGLAVQIRRLHDTGRSGWWWLVAFIPLIGPILLLVFYVQDSQPGDNQYGPNPKA